MAEIWDWLRAEHGAYRSLEVIGVWVEGSFTRVGIRVRFESGEDPQMYSWSGHRLAGFNSLPRLPRRTFQAIGRNRLAALDPASLEVTRVRFERTGGVTGGLVFTTGGRSVEVRCRPASLSSAPRTPAFGGALDGFPHSRE